MIFKKLRFFVVLPLFLSCKKEIVVTENSLDPQLQNYLKFISVTTQIPENNLVYDHEKQIFHVPSQSFKMNLDEVKFYYSTSNEYKLNYEKH